MFGPGDYLPDPSETITCPDDLPSPKVVRRSRVRKNAPVPPVNAPLDDISSANAHSDTSAITMPIVPSKSFCGILTTIAAGTQFGVFG